jgi:uncharacterized protein
MDISQLDGFLAGIVVGPETIVPSEFLPVVWGGEQPEFADMTEAETVLGAILGRYDEIANGLAALPPDYGPVLWQDALGNAVTEDWAVGFMQAVGLRAEAWEAALADEEAAMMLIPIGIIAGMAEPDIGLHDVDLPPAFLDELIEQAAELLPGCVIGLRAFWQDRSDAGDEAPPHPVLRH